MVQKLRGIRTFIFKELYRLSSIGRKGEIRTHDKLLPKQLR